jgi:hypothetical protein
MNWSRRSFLQHVSSFSLAEVVPYTAEDFRPAEPNATDSRSLVS